jgi:hypothetical protein
MKEKFCYDKASKIFRYYYSEAIKEFDNETAIYIAKIPADYVFNTLMKIYPDCYINKKCCLEYCNDVLDTEFNSFSPEFKRKVYNKAFSVSSNVSNGEIQMKLNAARKKFKEKYNEKENVKLSRLMERATLSPKGAAAPGSISSVFKELKLN